MGTIVRITRHLDSETVHLPEAHGLVGRDVEIVIREIGADEVATAREALRGSVLRYEDPFEPVAEDDWEALSCFCWTHMYGCGWSLVTQG